MPYQSYLSFDDLEKAHSLLYGPQAGTGPPAVLVPLGPGKFSVTGTGPLLEHLPPDLRQNSSVAGSGAILQVLPDKWQEKLPLFHEYLFEFPGRASSQVNLHHSRNLNDPLSQTEMGQTQKGLWQAALALEANVYLVTCDAGGSYTIPPKGHAQRLLLNSAGVQARIEAVDPKTQVLLFLCYSEAMTLSLYSSATWLTTEESITLQPGTPTSLPLQLNLAALRPGRNQGELYFYPARPGQKVTPLYKLPLLAEASASGVVPELEVSRLMPLVTQTSANGAVTQVEAFQREIVQGQQCRLTVTVRAHGKGRFQGMLLLLSENVEFSIEAGEQFQHTFTVDSHKLPPKTSGELEVKLVTDSYFANRQLLRKKSSYNFLYLEKSLPALDFGDMARDRAKTLTLDINRSDKKPVAIEVSPPETAARYLAISWENPYRYSFRLNPRNVPPGAQTISEVIGLTDSLSGLTTQIQVLAQVAPSLPHSVDGLPGSGNAHGPSRPPSRNFFTAWLSGDRRKRP